MPTDNEFTIAIVGDLHCHEEAMKPQESWLIASSRRKPAGNHPVQALISLIHEHPIRADVLICPGDLTNKISSAGMVHSWEYLRELNRELQSQLLITTIGNHDVDCKHLNNSDPFVIPRSIHEDFPIAGEEENMSFWANGFYFAVGPKQTDFVVLNTVIAHNDEASAKRGTFDHDRIVKLDGALTRRSLTVYKDTPPRFRVAVMHHHPLLHSSSRFSSADVLEFGDQLLAVLAKHGFRLVIHGHRHEPRITRQSHGLSEYFVFAAGSFSEILKELSTWTRNLFHTITIRCESHDRFSGEILSWEYNKGTGWRPSTSVSAALPHVARFATPKPAVAIEAIQARCNEAVGGLLISRDVQELFPQITELLPDELDDLRSKLFSIGVKLTYAWDGSVESIGVPQTVV